MIGTTQVDSDLVTGLAGGPAVTRTISTSRPGAAVFKLDQPTIITIDGPAGTGKSSVARMLARKLGLDFLDTGAMYRAAAYIALRGQIPISDHAALIRAVEEADLRFDWSLDPPEILVGGEPVGGRIRTPEVTRIVSAVAAIRELRAHLVERQRDIARKHPRLVSEGRDQGSVVFPDAHVKFYLDASAQVRARRRAEQLRAGGQFADERVLLEEIVARDHSDMTRTDGPLVRPDGGIIVDTSELEFDRVVAELERIVRRKADEA